MLLSAGSPQLALPGPRPHGGLQAARLGCQTRALDTATAHHALTTGVSPLASVPAALLVIKACSTHLKEPGPRQGEVQGRNFLEAANPRAHLLDIQPPHQALVPRPPSLPTLPAEPRCAQAPASRLRGHRGEGSARMPGVGAQGAGHCAAGASRDAGRLGARGTLVTAPSRLGSLHPAAQPQGGRAGGQVLLRVLSGFSGRQH